MSSRSLALAVLILTGVAVTQTAPPKAVASPPVPPPNPTLIIKLTAEPRVSIPVPDENWPAISAQCSPDGSPYVSTHLGGMDIAEFTHSGVVTFPANKVNDVPEPHFADFFVSDSGVYVHVTGLENVHNEELQFTDSITGKQHSEWVRRGEPRDYIAQFSTDGSYKSAVKVDVPRFTAYQIAAFDSGNFLVAGVDDQKVPRIALLNPSGQIVKYIELPKDITENSKSAQNVLKAWNVTTDIGAAALFAQFVPYRQNVLFIRSMMDTPIYEIRDGGEVHTIKVKPPSGYRMGSVIPSDRNWLIEFEKPIPGGDFGAAERRVDEVNPETGEFLHSFELAADSRTSTKMERGISCWYQNTFSAIRYKQGQLTLYSGTVEAAKSAPAADGDHLPQ